VGQWYSDKLKISTMNTYFQKCLTGVEKKKRGPNIQRMLKALAKASASIKPDKALAISEADALMVIKKLKFLGYKLESAAVELQFRTGLRMAEIKYITSEDVIFSNDSIIITVRRGKNIKSSRHIAKARF
jgi:integrase